MRLLVVLALCACQGSKKEAPPESKPVPADAVADDWTAACRGALTAKLAPVRKLSAVISGCRPCGDWKPLLDWNTPATEGGPPEQAILDAMDACKAYCSKDSKMVFAGTLGDARGKSTTRPWKLLGEKCKDAVSAVPDERFLSAPYFALDRIARAAAADPTLAPLLAQLELPLPALSLTGVGFELPTSTVMKPDPPRLVVTVTTTELRLGTLPRATLGANGVAVDGTYPGELVTANDIATKLPPDGAVTLLAPSGLAARRVVDVVAALGDREVVLAVAANGGPKGWTLPGIVPIRLDATPQPKAYEWRLDADIDAQIADLQAKPAAAFLHPRIVIGKDTTATHLAKLLGALAFRDARAASLAKK